jgi:DHA3 family tetracycline resistance protein-like MFS transporter
MHFLKKGLQPKSAFYLYRSGFMLGFHLMVTASGLYHIEAVGCNAFQLVVLGTILEASCFLFEVPTGIVADRYSRKRSLIIGLCIMGAGLILEGAISLFISVAIAQVVWGMGATFLSGADVAWLTDERQGEDINAPLMQGAKLGTLMQMIALPLGLWLYILRPGLPYFAGGGVLILVGLFLIKAMPEHHFKPAFTDTTGLARWTTPVIQGWKQIKGSKLLTGLIALVFLGGLFSEGFDRLWPVRFLEGTGLPQLGQWDPRYVFLMIRGGALLVTWALLHSVSAIQKKRESNGLWMVAILNILLAAVLYGFAQAVGFTLALAAFWPIWALRQAREPLMEGLVSQSIKDNEVRATVISMKGQVDQIGQMIGGPLIGYVAFKWGVPAGLSLSALWLLPLAGLAFWLNKKAN